MDDEHFDLELYLDQHQDLLEKQYDEEIYIEEETDNS